MSTSAKIASHRTVWWNRSMWHKKRYFFGLVATLIVVLCMKYMLTDTPVQIHLQENSVKIFGPGMDLLHAIIKVILTFSALYYLQFFALSRIRQYTSQEPSRIKDALLEMLQFALGYGKYILAITISTQWLILNETQEHVKAYIILIGFWFLVMWTITHIINHSFKNIFTDKVHGKFHQGYTNIKNFILVLIWILGVALLFDQFGYNVKALIAGAWVGGIAIAIACGRIFGNIFSSFIILINKPFQIGDTVRINSVFGTVEKIGMLYTDILDLHGQRVHIANEAIQNSVIENFWVRKFIRSDNILYLETHTKDTQIQQAIDGIKDIFRKYEQDKKILDKWMVVFDGFAPGGIKIKFRFKNCGGVFMEMMECREQILFEIKKFLQKKKIQIAHLTLDTE